MERIGRISQRVVREAIRLRKNHRNFIAEAQR